METSAKRNFAVFIDMENVGGKRVALEMKTGYPFDTAVKIRVVTCEIEKALPLYFRIPAWSAGVTVLANGKELAQYEEKNGFVCCGTVVEGGGDRLAFDKWLG